MPDNDRDLTHPFGEEGVETFSRNYRGEFDDSTDRRSSDMPDNKSGMEKLIAGVDAMLGRLDQLAARMDAMEAARATPAPPRPLVTENADGDKDEPPIPSDPDEVGEQGKAKPAAQDSSPLAQLRERRAKLAAFQQAADSVASTFGEAQAPPLTNESLNGYRRRVLQRWQKFSPDWKDVDLYGLSGSMLSVAADQIFSAAKIEGARPQVPQGYLMERKSTDGNGHYVTTFHGDPSVWMAQWSGPKRYVKRIALRPEQGYMAH